MVELDVPHKFRCHFNNLESVNLTTYYSKEEAQKLIHLEVLAPSMQEIGEHEAVALNRGSAIEMRDLLTKMINTMEEK